ncbi:MAG: TIGR03016 family PEP-CTERM system-associated outer membrane protein [Sulfuritalea sp.]|nr:TIGR03016 family PEP-CTERM system-associated outer membrane protein [Sulfuritalea sp.]
MRPQGGISAGRFKPFCWIAGAVGLLVQIACAHAQEDAAAGPGQPSWQITPSIGAALTLTDNARPGQTRKQGDLITSVTPGLRIDGKGGRVGGSLNFSWQQNFYANESRYNSDQKALSATGKAELVEQWLFLDAGATVAQSPTSVFATQAVGNELVTGNRSETRSFQWSPYVQGFLGGRVGYELRYRNTQTSADSGIYATGSGVDSQAWSGRLSGDTPLALLGWSVSAEDQRSRFAGREFESSRTLGTLEYRFDPQLKFNVRAGEESDNYSNFDLRKRTVSGYGLDWAPTERTLLKLSREQRSFGTGHLIDFSHRTALTAWRITDSKSVVVPAQQFTAAPVATAYDLLFLQLTSLYPDPVERAQAATLLLQLAGIPANSLIYGNIMSTQPFVQRRQQASVALTGANNTVTFSAQRSSSERIGPAVGVLNDFALAQNIRQSGLGASWAHRLTPHSALTLNTLASRSKGDAAAQDSRLRSLSLLYSTRLGAKTNASVGLRRNHFDGAGAVADYTENAITGSLTASF